MLGEVVFAVEVDDPPVGQFSSSSSSSSSGGSGGGSSGSTSITVCRRGSRLETEEGGQGAQNIREDRHRPLVEFPSGWNAHSPPGQE